MALLAAYASRKAAGADITEEVKIPAARGHAFSLGLSEIIPRAWQDNCTISLHIE